MSYSVIVLGGGIIGTSTAYYLTKLGVDVTLIEAKDIAAGTSGACDRAIMLQSKKPGPTLDLALESAKMYSTLEEELEKDLEYRKGGGMILIETVEELSAMQDLVKRQQKAGLNVQLISGEEARKRQPGLSEHILGSTWWEHDAEVNPLNVSFAMAKAAQRLGAKIKLQTKVTGLITEKDRVIGVDVSGEKIHADAVILALGIWTPLLLKQLNIDLPIIPRRGQILVSERVSPFIQCNILSGAYMASKLKKNANNETSADSDGIGLAIGQTHSGTLLIGGSREFAGYDLRTSADITRAIGKAAMRAFPEIENIRILRTFSGLRPYTPDGMPIIGPVAEIDGLHVAAGHEGDGIALAPITGKIIANVACGINPGFDIKPFSMKRFFYTPAV